MNRTTQVIRTGVAVAALLSAGLLWGTAAPAVAAQRSGQFSGVIESARLLLDGGWLLTLTGPKEERAFFCNELGGRCMEWQCSDVGRRVTVRYTRTKQLGDGLESEEEVDVITGIIAGPSGPVDRERSRVRCMADRLVIGYEVPEAVAAANTLGVWYEKGKHGLRKNMKDALYWYELAAKHGNALAMHNLGDLYRQGKGVRQDSREAFQWYKKAADAGHAIGLEDMADCYLKGVGVPPDREEALRLYRAAAARGRTSAAQKLREMGE